MAEIVFKAIGQVKAQFSETDVRAEGKELIGELEIYSEFEPALAGIDGYSHLFVLAILTACGPTRLGRCR